MAGNGDLRACHIRTFVSWYAVFLCVRVQPFELVRNDTDLLRRRIARTGVGVAAAERVSGRLRTVHGDRGWGDRNLLWWVFDSAARVQIVRRWRDDGDAFPIP